MGGVFTREDASLFRFPVAENDILLYDGINLIAFKGGAGMSDDPEKGGVRMSEMPAKPGKDSLTLQPMTNQPIGIDRRSTW